MSMLNNVVGLIFGDLYSGGAYIWNVVSVSICGGLILGQMPPSPPPMKSHFVPPPAGIVPFFLNLYKQINQRKITNR